MNVYSQMAMYLVNQLQRIQSTAGLYVLRKYAHLIDVINLNWLHIIENTEFSITKLSCSTLTDKYWPHVFELTSNSRVEIYDQIMWWRSNDEKQICFSSKPHYLITYQKTLDVLKMKLFLNRKQDCYKDEALVRA